MRGYTQLTRDERYQIYALRKAGHSQKEIAEVLRRNPSTISRELGRNKGLKGYRPEQAHRLAQNRKKERDRTRIPESTWARVEQLLREDWSPEQISGWLTREEGVSVSHERIYQHVYQARSSICVKRRNFGEGRSGSPHEIDSIFDNSLASAPVVLITLGSATTLGLFRGGSGNFAPVLVKYHMTDVGRVCSS